FGKLTKPELIHSIEFLRTRHTDFDNLLRMFHQSEALQFFRCHRSCASHVSTVTPSARKRYFSTRWLGVIGSASTTRMYRGIANDVSAPSQWATSSAGWKPCFSLGTTAIITSSSLSSDGTPYAATCE